MGELIAATDRATARVARAVVAEWDAVDLEGLSPTLRATAIQRAARLRGAFADLAAAAVPGVLACRELLNALGADSTQRRSSAESLVARVLRGNAPLEPESGAELEHALALELLRPVGVADAAARRGPLALRFGREGERLTSIRNNGAAHHDQGSPIEHRLDLRGRVALFDDAGPLLATGMSAQRARATPATSSLLVTVFLPPAAESEVEQLARDVVGKCERLLRSSAARSAIATLLDP